MFEHEIDIQLLTKPYYLNNKSTGKCKQQGNHKLEECHVKLTRDESYVTYINSHLPSEHTSLLVCMFIVVVLYFDV